MFIANQAISCLEKTEKQCFERSNDTKANPLTGYVYIIIFFLI